MKELFRGEVGVVRFGVREGTEQVARKEVDWDLQLSGLPHRCAWLLRVPTVKIGEEIRAVCQIVRGFPCPCAPRVTFPVHEVLGVSSATP